ncbi:hypothetical protein [Gimesia aquarii]|uniref:Uncharacterized protein n=1 Tax=Gimesia aquarii TaxID=2527964 RepID=A0A517VX39_9PLAN|nr:hypothetical protein [Gimesia aquarii]QDT97558.1 hypothetical protein V144x_30370 [Gimesia aquarii]
MVQSVGTILKGVCVGAFSGLLLGFYICVLTSQNVIQRADYTHPILYENADGRYNTAVILSFVLVFSVVGPFVASASYGRWMRHAIYGLVGCLAIVVAVALIGAAINNEQPFNMLKVAERSFIDAARVYGIPASFVIGPFAGIMIGRYRNKRREADTHQAVTEV